MKLGDLKGYVRNRAYPEGSTVKGYIVDELDAMGVQLSVFAQNLYP